MTIIVDLGRKATKQTNKQTHNKHLILFITYCFLETTDLKTSTLTNYEDPGSACLPRLKQPSGTP